MTLSCDMRDDEPEADFELTIAQKVEAIISATSYRPGWRFRHGEMGDGRYVQVVFNDPMMAPALSPIQHGRKWYVSPHSTRSEIVQTLFMAVKAAEEHEARERFRYCGQRIFGPHHDVAALADFCRTEKLDVRK